MQDYVIKIVSDLRQVGGFLRFVEILLNVSLSTIVLIQVLTVCCLAPWEQFLLAISWREHATFLSEMMAIFVLIYINAWGFIFTEQQTSGRDFAPSG